MATSSAVRRAASSNAAAMASWLAGCLSTPTTTCAPFSRTRDTASCGTSATGHRAVCSISLATEHDPARSAVPRLFRPKAIISAPCRVNSHNVGTTGPKHRWLAMRAGCRPIPLATVCRVLSTTSTPWATTALASSLGTGVVGTERTCTMVSSTSRIAASPAAHTAAAVDAGDPSTPTTIRSMANLCSCGVSSSTLPGPRRKTGGARRALSTG
ncbi:MAG: hypothetical protein QOG14_2429 [Mycobacterium sp.]|nr:hypothetical protein [Mycobacterium sp.]